MKLGRFWKNQQNNFSTPNYDDDDDDDDDMMI